MLRRRRFIAFDCRPGVHEVYYDGFDEDEYVDNENEDSTPYKFSKDKKKDNNFDRSRIDKLSRVLFDFALPYWKGLQELSVGSYNGSLWTHISEDSPYLCFLSYTKKHNAT